MMDSLIALLLIAEVMLTAYLLIRYRQRRCAFWRPLVGLFIGAEIFLIFSPALAWENHDGAVHILAITSLCFGLALMVTLIRLKLNILLLGINLVMMIGLPWWASSLEDITFFGSERKRLRDSIISALVSLPKDGKVYSAGWLADQPFTSNIPRDRMVGYHYVPHPLWHSRFTGMYRLEVIEGEAWWPGGTTDNAYRKIEVRRRN